MHFIQEPFDQASLVRPYLKWEWTLPSGVVVKEALRRAVSIMQSEPRGPVYLMMQRETLTQNWSADEIRSYSGDAYAATSRGGGDPKLAEAIADKLLAAESPILITGYAGRHAHSARAIDALAQFAGIAVYEVNTTNNISHDSPCFVGFCPEGGAEGGHRAPGRCRRAVVSERREESENSFWAHIDIDTLKPGSPMWTFPGNLRMQGDSGRILEQVLEDLKAKATPRFKAAAAERLTRIKTLRDERIARAAKLATDKGQPGAVNPHYLMAELGKVLDDDDIIFNEGITNAAAVFLQIPRPVPNTLIRRRRRRPGLVERHGAWCQACGAGSPDGADFRRRRLLFRQSDLGLRDRPAIQVAVSLDRAGQHRLERGEAIDAARLPGRRSQDRHSSSPSLRPIKFSKVGEAFGAYAEELTEPAEVPAALARCIQEVRGGRAALLHVRVTKM